MNGFFARIYIADGVYTEDIKVFDFFGSYMRLLFGTCVLNGSITVSEASVTVQPQALTINVANGVGITSENRASVEAKENVIINGSLGTTKGILVYVGGTFMTAAGNQEALGTIEINNCGTAIASNTGSTAAGNFISTMSNDLGYYANGGVINVGNDGLVATTKALKRFGGQVLTGAGVDLD